VGVLAFGSIEEWREQQHQHQHSPPPSAILLNVGGRRIVDPAVGEEIKRILSEFEPTPVIVLADTDELGQIVKALEYGAKGYIPSSVSIDVCIEAIALALAGGIFVPASSILAMHQLLESGNTHPLASMFTSRQAEVVEALRRGKANKVIAYELNLRESTVKVHIRNIMKKVKATNRTEVAYKINDLFPHDLSTNGAI
jgi:DNA-binding NarL/FixJ family response regulator